MQPVTVCASIAQARERMTKSTVVDSATGGSVDSDVRTSTGSFYSRDQDEVRTLFGFGSFRRDTRHQ